MEQSSYHFSQLPALLQELRKHWRIAVVYAGNRQDPHAVLYQSENHRPWKSYQAVAEDIQNALQEAGFSYVYTFPDDLSLIDNLKRERIQFVWLNTGGVQGINPMSHTAGIMEMLAIPYIGHNPLHVTLLDNKHIFKHLLKRYSIPTSPFLTWDGKKGKFLPDGQTSFREVFAEYNGPFIVKPVSGRASLHVQYVAEARDLTEAVAEVYNQTKNVVLSQLLPPTLRVEAGAWN